MRKRPLSDDEGLYEDQLNFLDGMPTDEFDLDYELSRLTQEEREVLTKYFFMGREIDVDDVFDYRDDLLAADATMARVATNTLRKFLYGLVTIHYENPDWESLLNSQNGQHKR